MATYNNANSTQTYTVPDGVTAINVTVQGAGGGDGGGSNDGFSGGSGGKGGYASCRYSVSPGDEIEMLIAADGGNGEDGPEQYPAPQPGHGGGSPYYSGGDGAEPASDNDYSDAGAGGGGGGSTLVRRKFDGETIAIAEGGGGGSGADDGNYGGPGGGGARGGSAGATAYDTGTAEDGGGSGNGGAGGDASKDGAGNPGGDGGYAFGPNVTDTSGYSGSGNSGSASVTIDPIYITSAPSLSVDSTGSNSVTLDIGDADYEDGVRVYYRNSSDSSWTEDADLGADVTPTLHTVSGLSGIESYDFYVEAYNANSTDSSSTVTAETTPQTPSSPASASLTVNANDSIDLTVDPPSDWGGEVGSYEIEMSRDEASYVSPSGGPSNPSGSTSTETYNYGPSSDSSYDSQIGIDSSFKFRVRATNSGGTSSWTESGTKYTEPIPPHNPSVSRPDANTIEVSWTDQTDGADGWGIEIREDAGSGYGSWNEVEYDYNSSKGTSHTITLDTSNHLVEDSRYQVRLRHFRFSDIDNDGDNERQSSEYVYADYGNNGNVYFEDDFESQDFSSWSSTTLNDADSGVYSGTNAPGSGDAGISGADEGTYYSWIESGDSVVKNLGDLSGESNVIVKCAISVGSMDTSSEAIGVYWYDGSSWQNLQPFGWEYNKQGWVEFSVPISSSLLSTDNRVRITGTGGSGDHAGFDRVVVSDILHEYTKPAAPTNPTTDETVERELGLDWTDNTSLDHGDTEWFHRVYNSGDSFTKEFDSPPHTWTGLTDGEKYEWYPSAVYAQKRNGSSDSWWRADGPTVTATTILPIPGTPSASSTSGDLDVDLSWVNNDNSSQGDTDIEWSSDGGSSWVDATTGLNAQAESYSHPDGSSGETYEFRVERNTPHATATSGSVTVAVPFPLTIDGEDVMQVTIDGTEITGETIDGS